MLQEAKIPVSEQNRTKAKEFWDRAIEGMKRARESGEWPDYIFRECKVLFGDPSQAEELLHRFEEHAKAHNKLHAKYYLEPLKSYWCELHCTRSDREKSFSESNKGEAS